MQSSLPGMDFNDIWESRIQEPYGGPKANFTDGGNPIKSKRISNRFQDRAELERLQGKRSYLPVKKNDDTVAVTHGLRSLSV